MRQKSLFLLFFFFLCAFPLFSADLPQNTVPENLRPIARALALLPLAPYLQIKLGVSFQHPEGSIRGSAVFYAEKNPSRNYAKINASASLQGAEFRLDGKAVYVNNTLYFEILQVPFTKPVYLKRWFALNFEPFKEAFPKASLESFSNERNLSFSNLNKLLKENLFFLNQMKVMQRSDEMADGILCRHYTVVVPISLFFQMLFSKALQNPHAPFQDFQFSPKSLSQIPPVPVDFWIGKKDGRLYRIFALFKNKGDFQVNVSYKKLSPLKFFSIPQNATDARVLRLFSPSLFAPYLPHAIPPKPKEANPITGTVIYLQTLTPYSGPSPEDLKEFLAKRFGLQNVKILTPIPISETAFNTFRLQYNAIQLLRDGIQNLKEKKLDTPGAYLILLTDQDLYLPGNSKFDYIAMYNKGSSCILSFNHLVSPFSSQTLLRAEKLLARILGFVYWHFPTTTLPQDLMRKNLVHLPQDLDEVGVVFLEDKSLELRNKGLSEADPRKAEEDLKKAIRYNPLNAYNDYLLGQIQYRLGEYSQCVESLNQAIFLDPFNADAFSLLGQVYKKLGKLGLAKEEFQAADFLKTIGQRHSH
jgi:tetratricopeptide (TPR) repeat protein